MFKKSLPPVIIPVKVPMPGISDVQSCWMKRPPMITVDVEEIVLSEGGALGVIQYLFAPFHVPESFARYACIGPGVAASIMAFMSASVMPGGRCGAVPSCFAAGSPANVLRVSAAAPTSASAHAARVRVRILIAFFMWLFSSGG